jgi:hypothetical protein
LENTAAVLSPPVGSTLVASGAGIVDATSSAKLHGIQLIVKATASTHATNLFIIVPPPGLAYDSFDRFFEEWKCLDHPF